MNYKEKQKRGRLYVPTKIELLNEVILVLNDSVEGKKYLDLYCMVFQFTQGDNLDEHLKAVLIQLCDDDIIRTEPLAEYDSFAVENSKKTNSYHIMGKGIKLCDNNLLKSKPYTYYKRKMVFETLFTKYLPIIISVTALVISYLGYHYKVSHVQ